MNIWRYTVINRTLYGCASSNRLSYTVCLSLYSLWWSGHWFVECPDRWKRSRKVLTLCFLSPTCKDSSTHLRYDQDYQWWCKHHCWCSNITMQILLVLWSPCYMHVCCVLIWILYCYDQTYCVTALSFMLISCFRWISWSVVHIIRNGTLKVGR